MYATIATKMFECDICGLEKAQETQYAKDVYIYVCDDCVKENSEKYQWHMKTAAVAASFTDPEGEY